MSASLVGSEMCIRDRLSSPGRAEQADLRGAFRVVCRGWAWAPRWAPAVGAPSLPRGHGHGR
eukprot:4770460-Alexandrium_andersonii.AAC.1